MYLVRIINCCSMAYQIHRKQKLRYNSRCFQRESRCQYEKSGSMVRDSGYFGTPQENTFPSPAFQTRQLKFRPLLSPPTIVSAVNSSSYPEIVPSPLPPYRGAKITSPSKSSSRSPSPPLPPPNHLSPPFFLPPPLPPPRSSALPPTPPPPSPPATASPPKTTLAVFRASR